MKSYSLVGLKATDVVRELAEEGVFCLTSYREPIAIVLPVYASKHEFFEAVNEVARVLFDEPI